MKFCIACVMAVLVFDVSATARKPDSSRISTGMEEIVEHGGGCRKSSPPGQCCHADNSRGGAVHCH